MSELSNLDQIDITGKKVFMRVDFNVPLIEGKIISDIRILEAIPTIKLILSKGAAVIIGSHLGRPKGKIIPELSISPIADILKQHLKLPNIMVASDVIGESAISLSTKLLPGDVMFLENLRFESGEETNDLEMAKVLASMADVFVNDAFSCSHRAHSSVLGITSFLPSVAGLSMQKEIDMLNKVLKKPIKPVTAIVGGSKISTKLAILEHLIEKVDNMIIGGAMANTFLFANGYSVGKSLFESDMLETATNILKEAQLKSCSISLPKDAIVAEDLENKEGIETVVGKFPFAASGRALAMGAGSDGGFVRITSRKDNQVIVGIHAVGSHVSELSGEFALALEMGARLDDIAGTIHVHPTLTEAFAESALASLGHAIHISN